MKRDVKWLILFILFYTIPYFAFAEEITLNQIAEIQQSAASEIETMAASVESEIKLNNQMQPLSYDYLMQIDAYGNNKIMVTSKGIFTMQYLADTSDNSVTFLMGNGQTKRYELPENMQTEIQQMASLSGFGGGINIRSMIVQSLKASGVKTDAAIDGVLNTDEYENEDVRLKVKKEFFGNTAVLEYHNKRAEKARLAWEESVDKIRTSNPKNKGAEKIKKRAMEYFQGNKEKALGSLIAKRVEKINLKTGMVEEQEMYDYEGNKIGWFKVKKAETRKVKRSKFSKARTNNIKMASAGELVQNDVPEEAEIVIATETEGEMDSPQGKTKTRSRLSNVKVNEGAEFKWMDVKRIREERNLKRKRELEK